ncbi:hypothetical protein Q2941_39830 [Bradyrhizobium sp. UFLA05-153]
MNYKAFGSQNEIIVAEATDEVLQDHGEAAVQQRGSEKYDAGQVNNVVATKALAHKLARASYHILKEGKPFEVTRCFA